MLMLVAGLITVGTLTNSIALLTTQSGSMLPRYTVDALLIAVPADWETIREGDVITVNQAGDNKFITHRVVSVSDTVEAGETVFLYQPDGSFERTKLTEDTKANELTGGSGIQVGKANVAVKMKGDANPSADAEIYLIRSQVWKPIFQIRGAGVVFDFLATPNLWLYAVGIYVVAMVGLMFIRPKRSAEQAEDTRTTVSPPTYTEFINREGEGQ